MTPGPSRSPADLLEWLRPKLTSVGVTRIADLTGLDRLGIPVVAAIRPAAVLLQVSNGKGPTLEAATVGAVMEAAEQAHAEAVPSGMITTSLKALRAEGRPAVAPEDLPVHPSTPEPTPAWKERRPIDWMPARDLFDPQGPAHLLPAAAAWLRPRSPFPFGTNGLAAGIDGDAAILHGLLEAIERDAVAAAMAGGLSLRGPHAAVLRTDPAAVMPGALCELVERIRRAGLTVRVLRLTTPQKGVATCLAAILDPDSSSAATLVNIGHASHPYPAVAAEKAILEAAQARMTFLHGTREDLRPAQYRRSPAHDRLSRTLLDEPEVLSWAEAWHGHALPPPGVTNLALLSGVLGGLRERMQKTLTTPRCWVLTLDKPDIGIAVRRVLVPGLEYLKGFAFRSHR